MKPSQSTAFSSSFLDYNNFQIKNMFNMQNMNKYLYSKLSTDDAEILISDSDTYCPSQSYCDKFLNLFPELSYSQRLTLFAMSLAAGSLFFILSLMYLPVLVFKTRKFALLFTLGSIFVLMSFFFLNGPVAHLKSLMHKDRIMFTLTYFTTLFTTLYTSLYLKSTFLTLIVSIAQIFSLICYLLSIIPGGSSGFKFLTRMFYNSAGSSLPI